MALRAEFLKAVNSAVVLGTFSGDPAVVKGLNSLTMPVESRDLLTFSTFGVDFQTQEVGEGKRSAAAFSGYTILGDEEGQNALEAAMVAQTKLKDVRFYFDSVTMHFRALDLANDPDGFFQVSKAGPDGAAGKNDSYKFSGEMPCGGAIKTFAYHVTASDIAFVATGSKITSTTTDFEAAGFKAGRTIIIDTGTNKGYAKITTVSENEIVISTLTTVTGNTVATGVAVMDAAAGATTLHASTY
ncbi:hypothetical protein DFW101_3498 [Solidesulfovibrio carbinoliphilus subsp. oakridgensis]|uniref:Uncharacterized protein n=1 Tax=Solidesulfovibrio carbinoliphilus subsp. oakridgensis TaxID=694327 RepID=G7QC48_9BACT|nr:hypothetical protein [Solidesulfovibrio carbinoliphilus]EHJ49494.1 hypothetical protein DFW101_3498 [Solidesulfovibrio carbinoliphilus subsp. oakridgensis]